jgi:integrase
MRQCTRKAAKLTDFRFHDIRHDVGTKLLRATGNLKLVQRALNHSDVQTTTRYAHVLDEEVGAALDLIAKSRKQIGDAESRNESRSETADAA